MNSISDSRCRRATPANLLGQSSFTFRDARYAELLFRYRARNWPETLALDERERWEQFRHQEMRVMFREDYRLPQHRQAQH